MWFAKVEQDGLVYGRRDVQHCKSWRVGLVLKSSKFGLTIILLWKSWACLKGTLLGIGCKGSEQG